MPREFEEDNSLQEENQEKSLPYHILLIEDDEDDTLMFQEMLREVEDFRFKLEVVDSLEKGIEILQRDSIDIVFLDLNLPESSGISTLKIFIEQEESLPIVVLTGIDDERLGIKAVQKGAQDYLIKGQVTGNLLTRVIRYSIERKHTEEMIKTSLKEKEVLLKEIHHRVKNNLQVICSLLNLQSRYIVNKDDLKMFKESQDRIRSIALIHDRLYKSNDLAHIDFYEYIHSLANDLFRSYGMERERVSLEVNIKDFSIGLDLAIPCGLIINELLANALKYAFPQSYSGKAKIGLFFHKTNKGEVKIIIEDNGIGMPKGFNIHKTESLGIFLVVILVENQLNGKISLNRNQGTKYIINFPISK